MAEFERPAGWSGAAARPVYGQRSSPPTIAVSSEPMQRAIDAWHREQPEAFARAPEPAVEADAADASDHAIALNHLLGYGRLAAERDLAALRDRAATDGSPVLAPLQRQTEARTAQILQAAPSELHPSLRAGFAPTAGALAEKAAAIDALTADRRRAGALAQSIELAEALLRQDPEQYEILVADAGAMADGLGLDAEQHRTLMGRVRERFASATLLAQLDPVAGDPDQADQDLQRGRFRDAFNKDGIAAWRELVAANQARAAAAATRAGHEAGIVAEIKMLNRLAAAGRGEAPMPAPAEVETVFPGEGETRLAATKRALATELYADEIAAQPFDRDQAWIEAAADDEDRAIRTEAVQRKHREFAQSGGGTLLKQYPALGAAVEAGIADPAKLDLAIALYQRQLAKLGVPPEMRQLLPSGVLTRLGRAEIARNNGGSSIFGGDGQDRFLGGETLESGIAALDRANDGDGSPTPIPLHRPPRREPPRTQTDEAGHPAWHTPPDAAQALAARAAIEDGRTAALTPEQQINLLRYWYAQPEAAITDADKLAMRNLFVAMPIDPSYLAYEQPIQGRILASIRGDQVVINGLRKWSSLPPDQWRTIMERIVSHTAQAYGIDAPSIVFNEALPRTTDGAVAARFVEADNVIEINPTNLNPPPEAHQLFRAEVDVPARIIEETAHAYQWVIKKLYGAGKILDSDPRFAFAEQISLQQPWMYINPSEGIFVGDQEGYEKQPRERHAKLVSRQVANDLWARRQVRAPTRGQ